MSTHEQEGDAGHSWLAFKTKFEKGPQKPKARTPRGRADYEAEGIVPDGRSDRSTGRTLKMTVKVKPEFKQRLAAMAAKRGVGMAEVLEAALDALEGKRA